MISDFDDILKEIAKALHKDSEIDDVGKALGFEPADIGRTIEDNVKQEGNYMETLDLLRTWRNRQTPSTEKAALRSALLRAGFENLAFKYLRPLVTDETTYFPSSPNTMTSISAATTTATITTTTHKAFLVIAILTWAAVSVSGTTSELSTTTGDTVNIPCLFGEATLRYILVKWYFSDRTGHRMILKPANGDFIIGAQYTSRATLLDDYSTLILKEITVADEGFYHCVVDTLKQTVVSNIKTKLNVFSLRPDTLPVISPCSGADESSSCNIHANKSFTLNCTIPNVYPVDDTELIWYQDGKRVSSIHDITQNNDGTTDISRQIQISETGNLTCNATYLSANGIQQTAVSVEAWIISQADVPNTPGKNVTSGQIAGIVLGIVVLVGISLAIITVFRYRSKTRGGELSTHEERREFIHIGDSFSWFGPFKSRTGKLMICVTYSKRTADLSVKLRLYLTNYVTNAERHLANSARLRDAKRIGDPQPFFVKWSEGDVHVAVMNNKCAEETKSISIKDIRCSIQTYADFAGLKTEHYEQLTMRVFQGKETQIVCSNPLEKALETETRGNDAEGSALRVTRLQLFKLSESISHEKYTELCVRLGCSITSSDNVLAKHGKDYQKALLEVLNEWNQRTELNHRDKLIQVLVEAEVADLITQIFPDYVHEY